MSIFLIGYRGSGKTTLGRGLAGRLGLDFYDCDDWIVRRAGKSIREIFQQSGEETFRDLEQAAMAELAQLPHGVIGLGGGTLQRDANRRMLKSRPGHRIVYIRAEPAELLRRIQLDPQSGANRPNLTALGGGIDEIQTVLTRREPIYREMMTDELDVTRLSIDAALSSLENIVRAVPKR